MCLGKKKKDLSFSKVLLTFFNFCKVKLFHHVLHGNEIDNVLFFAFLKLL